jgi:hypothetical protein
MKWLADENFRQAIIRGVAQRMPGFDSLRAQDVPEIAGRDDVTLLEWATRERRILLTHDVSTMQSAMLQVLTRQQECAPIVLVNNFLPTLTVIEGIILLDQCFLPRDWEAGLIRLPL